MSRSINLAILLRRDDCNGAPCFSTGPQANAQSSSSSNLNDGDFDDDQWPTSNAGYIVRYVIITLFILIIVLWIIIGIWHANRRIRKGLPPLWYHKWLVTSRRYPQHGQHPGQTWPRYGNQYYNPQGQYGPTVPPGQSYPMHAWHRSETQPPPPLYTNDPPPTYAPPAGPPPGREPKGSDAAPSTTVSESATRSYPAPSHPPPSASIGNTGTDNRS